MWEYITLSSDSQFRAKVIYSAYEWKLVNNISRNFLIPHITILKKILHCTPLHIYVQYGEAKLCPPLFIKGPKIIFMIHIFIFRRFFFGFFGTFWGGSWCGWATYFLNFYTTPHPHKKYPKFPHMCTCERVQTCAEMLFTSGNVIKLKFFQKYCV